MHLKKWLGAAVLFLILSCSDPAGMCSCPPSRSHVELTGAVLTATGAPIVNASVTSFLYRGACGSALVEQTSEEGFLAARSDTSGNYSIRAYSMYEPADRCLKVIAVHPTSPADSAVVEGLYVRTVIDRQQPNRYRIDLIVR